MMNKTSAEKLYKSLTQIRDDARIGELLKYGPRFDPKTPAEHTAAAALRAFMQEFEIRALYEDELGIMPDQTPSNGITPLKAPTTRQDLFVKDGAIYILDSIQKQRNIKLSSFAMRIADVFKPSTDKDNLLDEIIAHSNGPQVSIYVNCPDTEIDPRANKIIQTLAAAKQSGMHLDIHVIGNPHGAWAKMLPSIEKYASIPAYIPDTQRGK